MLAITHLHGFSGGFGALGYTAEMHRILGVPFWWEKFSLFGVPGYKLVEHVGVDGNKHFNVIYIPKDKTPKALAAAIDQVLARTSVGLLKSNPDLAKNPKELLKQAKIKSRLAPTDEMRKAAAALGMWAENAFLGYLDKVNGIGTESRSIFVREEGDRWRIHLKDRPSGSSIPGVDLIADVAEGIAKGISATVSTTVNFAAEGFEWALNLIEKLACTAVKSDLVKKAATTYAISQGGPEAAAATNAAIKAVQSICAPAPKPPAPTAAPKPAVALPIVLRSKYPPGSLARYNLTTKLWSIYIPIGSSISGISGFGLGADEPPPGTTKGGEEPAPVDPKSGQAIQQTPDKEGVPLYKKPLFWIAVAGTAALGTGAVVLVRRRSKTL